MRQAERPSQPPSSLGDEVRSYARSLGFHRVGVASAQPALDEDHARYEAFVDAGMHGAMGWLGEHRDVRRAVDNAWILEGARSVVVCAMAYHRADERDAGGGVRGARVARYARGRDYHNFVRKRLRRLAAWLRAKGFEARAMVDTAPVLERAWARRAGVGFVGKHGLVIAPGLGSYVLLGEVVTTAELPPDEPMESRCGACTACLDACPTGAFPRPFVLDARRCVSYLTIELEGAIPVALREGVGENLFGCDACQEACPYNRAAPPPEESTAPFATAARSVEPLDLARVAELDDAGFAALTEGSPLARPGREGLARNALTVMGNSGDARYVPALERVAAREPEGSVLGDAARWAIARIASQGAVHATPGPSPTSGDGRTNR